VTSNQAACGRLTTLLAGALLGAALLLATAIVALAVLLREALPLTADDYRPFNVVVAIGFSAAGFAIVRRQPANLIGWLFLAGAVGNGLYGAGLSYAVYDRSIWHGMLPGAAAVVGLVGGAWIPLPMALAFTLAVFPDGHPLTARWRPLLYAMGGGFALWLAGVVTTQPDPSALPAPLAGLRNPFALPFGGQLANVGLAVVVAGVAGAVVSLVLRVRRSRGVERQQLKWLAVAAVPLFLSFVDFFGPSSVLVSVLAVTLFVAPIALAILRYRLYDLDLVVNRALVYAALSVLVVAFYVAVIGASALVASGSRPQTGPIVATVAAALLALPLHRRLQLLVNRLLYGRRHEPLSVVIAVGRRLEAAGTPEDVLRGVVGELGGALRLAGLEVSLAGGGALATFGSVGASALRLRLVHQGEVVGDLRAAPRRGEGLSPRDLRLLEDLRPQLGVALHGLRLTEELRGSRERLVLAREEERRRIRRDLHDGLGPALTGIAMQADAARNRLGSEPAVAAELLAQVRSELTSAISEIRRLVYGLRPPALDELGLVQALRQQADSVAGGRRDGSMAVEVVAPGELCDLPAAVEVAAYRIAAEAIHNAARHSGAAHCRVRIRAGEELELDVSDDGRGWPAGTRPGVGWASMRERTEELGGRLVIEAAEGGGSRVQVSLPLRAQA
jgi:signal transduction histidine kinase